MSISVHPSIKSIFETGSGTADTLVTYSNAQQFFAEKSIFLYLVEISFVQFKTVLSQICRTSFLD